MPIRIIHSVNTIVIVFRMSDKPVILKTIDHSCDECY